MSKETITSTIDFSKISDFAKASDRAEIDGFKDKAPEDLTSDQTRSGLAYTGLLAVERLVSYPELAAFGRRISSGAELNEEERSSHLSALVSSLEPTSKSMRNIDSPGSTLKPFPNDLSNQEEVRAFLESVSTLSLETKDPGIIAAKSALALMDGKSTTEVKADFETTSSEYNAKIKDQVNHDIVRNSLVVRKGDEVLAFYSFDEFSSWGKANGLTGEQIGLAAAFTDQGIATGWENNGIVKHSRDKEGKPVGFAAVGDTAFDPPVFLDISPDGLKVSLSLHFRSRAIVTVDDEPTNVLNTTISSLHTDISDLRGETYTPGVLSTDSTRLTGTVSFLDTEVVGPSIPDAILDSTQISTSEHLKEYATTKIRSATSLKLVHDLFACSHKGLRDMVAAELPKDPRFSSKDKIVETVSKSLESEKLASKDPSDISKALLKLKEIAQATGFYDEMTELTKKTLETLSPEQRAETLEILRKSLIKVEADSLKEITEKSNSLYEFDKLLTPEEIEKFSTKPEIDKIKGEFIESFKNAIIKAAQNDPSLILAEIENANKICEKCFQQDAKDVMSSILRESLSKKFSITEAVNFISSVRAYDSTKGIKESDIDAARLLQIAKNEVKPPMTEASIESISDNIDRLYKSAHGMAAEVSPREFILHTAAEKGVKISSGFLGHRNLAKTSDKIPAEMLGLSFTQFGQEDFLRQESERASSPGATLEIRGRRSSSASTDSEISPRSIRTAIERKDSGISTSSPIGRFGSFVVNVDKSGPSKGGFGK